MIEYWKEAILYSWTSLVSLVIHILSERLCYIEYYWCKNWCIILIFIHSCTILYTFYWIKMHYHYMNLNLSVYLAHFIAFKKMKTHFKPTWELSGTIMQGEKIVLYFIFMVPIVNTICYHGNCISPCQHCPQCHNMRLYL